VRGLDLAVQSGECFGLLGPNGAGKTTTIEILEGLVTPSAGRVRVLGRDWAHDADAIRQRIGITLQHTYLSERLTVAEILAMFQSFYHSARAVDEVLAQVSLHEKRDSWFDRLSGGQKQRVAVACALVGDPELLFLDEPTTGLDPQSRRQLWDVIADFKARGRTVLLTTHYMDEAERLCDRVAIVDHGQVIALGRPRDLIAEHVGGIVLNLTTDQPVAIERLQAVATASRTRVDGCQAHLTVENLAAAVPSLLTELGQAGIVLQEMQTHQPTLEDVFVTLTGRHLRD
jgi:ABC-2 type transport system ATP-binding protein